VEIAGLPMIEHVRRRVLISSRIDRVIVATCDEAIRQAVEKNCGTVCMTSDKHERCTERVAEAAAGLEADVIVIAQGDCPMILPEMVDLLIAPFLNGPAVDCVDLIAPITSREKFESPNVVKVVIDQAGEVLYYSREPIPFGKRANKPFDKYEQLGMMAFRKEILLKYVKLEPTPLEKTESVDMLRLLEHGLRIKTAVTNSTIYGVDIPADLEKVEKLMRNDPLAKKYAGRRL
jgi:3-deoxy-manno-octulosonate cytidylyltransferase (CMP-KDO synthetase)